MQANYLKLPEKEECSLIVSSSLWHMFHLLKIEKYLQEAVSLLKLSGFNKY